MTAKHLYRVTGFLFVLALWQGVVSAGVYDRALLPSPLQVVGALRELLCDGTLWGHVTVSMERFIAGYGAAAVLGVFLGLFFGWFGSFWRIADPVVQVVRPISPIAWLPFVVLLFGIGDLPAMVIIFIAAFFPILLATVSSVGRIDQGYFKVARNFNMSRPRVMTSIVLPAAFPYITIGLHTGVGTAWVFLVAGEMIGAQSGLGFLVIDARNNLRPDMLLAAIFLIGISGLILDKLLLAVERSVERRWGVETGERRV